MGFLLSSTCGFPLGVPCGCCSVRPFSACGRRRGSVRTVWRQHTLPVGAELLGKLGHVPCSVQSTQLCPWQNEGGFTGDVGLSAQFCHATQHMPQERWEMNQFLTPSELSIKATSLFSSLRSDNSRATSVGFPQSPKQRRSLMHLLNLPSLPLLLLGRGTGCHVLFSSCLIFK